MRSGFFGFLVFCGFLAFLWGIQMGREPSCQYCSDGYLYGAYMNSDHEKSEGDEPPTPRYYLSSTGVRHNETCKYYRNDGYRELLGNERNMCTKKEGRACKICGG